MTAFIDSHRDRFGVEPICRILDVSASAYYPRARQEPSTRQLQDERLLSRIGEVHLANYEAYGYRRTWKGAAACRRAGAALSGAAADAHSCNPGRQAPRQAVANHQARSERASPAGSRAAAVHRRGAQPAVGRGSVLSQMLGRGGLFRVRHRCPQPQGDRLAARVSHAHRSRPRRAQNGVGHPTAHGADFGLVAHTDRGSQYTSAIYTQTLADHQVLASVGTVGDALDNAVAESFVDSFKTELIADRVWRTKAQLELAIVEYVSWFNHDRLHGALGDIPPVEFEDLAARRLKTIAR